MTKKTTRLTHSLDVFDECPHVSPDGSRIAWNEKGNRLLLGVAFEEKPRKLQDYLILLELPN